MNQEIQTLNMFAVGATGHSVRVVNVRKLTAAITRDEALNLAAYLLLMVECIDLGTDKDTAADFEALRAALEAT